jgi:transmembrane sensor
MSKINSLEFFLNQESFKNWATGENEEDCRYWDNWVKENPEQQSVAMLAVQIYTGLKSEVSSIKEEEIRSEWNKLKSRINSIETTEKTIVINSRFWWQSAAAAVIFLAISGLSYFVSRPTEAEYATGFSGKKTITLLDGTEIILNSNSKLKAKSSWFFAPAREIWLDGEAYFNVVSHLEDPKIKQFVVHTKDLDVKVLGTQFNVNTRKNSTRVYLNEGKVELALKENIEKSGLLMAPGEFVDYSSVVKTKKELKKRLPSEVVTSWKSGYFSFNQTPLKEVIEMVEATHGIKITVTNPALLKETITGKVPSENINELVKSMTSLFNLKYTMNGSELILQEN